jgi:hypothetical protein
MENPTAISIEEIEVSRGDSITVKMAPGGGFAISLLKL